MASGFKIAEGDSVRPGSPEDWEAWLAANFSSSTGTWVVFEKKSKVFHYGHALDSALCYGWIDGQKRSLSETSWTQWFVPRTKRSIWSKINCAKALGLIEAGRMNPAGLAEVERAQADGRWGRAYDGPAKAEVPEDLAAALNENPKAKAFFETLRSNNRYAILFRLQTAKKPETRAKRLKLYVEMLEEERTLH